MTDHRHAHQGLPDLHLHHVRRGAVVRKARIAAVVAVALLAVGLGRTLFMRHAEAAALEQEAARNAVLSVNVVLPSQGRGDAALTLPATLQGMAEAQIYARTSGYIKRWYKDIGQPVKKGELLAELDIPDIDKQAQEARANFELAKTAYLRWKTLRAQDAVSQQEFDEKETAYKQTEAELKRLRDLQDFARVSAPFDGIVTRRNIDTGSLVNAGNGGAPQALFATAQIDKLHLYAYVPQGQAAAIHIGSPVKVTRQEAPDQAVSGKVVRTAGALDAATRTLQVEVMLANADHGLMPGQYVDVSFKLPRGQTLTLPTNALQFGAKGSRVALVGADSKVHLQTVAVGTDFGHEVEIRAGLKTDDKVIINPPDSIYDGQKVAIVPMAKGA
ncbi:efflux RND transporter periplasmic adaptor subunit [Chromobacterium sp. IIBBL 290-4]|uniref:efflux RND transporter periplasmic adaptor subunit n=1 Tax=Chromobacterium sp. IIBBL 290-4 TaxID=2953890 RepID=UPI0020B7A83A|nr:efflux RND transporter periplasmic adaptor subunit [Chromobacterium sp. IIBBL 290-4]UTH72254.1 efflux RND transporter periplasmic adaptor subunit [Chromobacterium sp. IIBBL 290-4]